MPKELTHWILADRVLAGLSDGSHLRDLFLKHHDCYLGGSVLPDTLLHLFYGPHARTALEQLADEAVQCTTILFERMEAAGSLAVVLSDCPGENLLTGIHGACLSAMEICVAS